MATKQRKLFKQAGSNNWHSQFGYISKNSSRKTYKKSLGTSDKQEAWRRYDEINAKLDDIKDGMRFTWSWERQSKTSQVKIHTVQDAFDKYIMYQEIRGFKVGTWDKRCLP
jgi:hypothetical protein